MRRLRAYYRLVLFFLVTLYVAALRAASRLVFHRYSSRDLAFRQRLFRLWGRSVLRILKVRLQVQGTPPDPPFFLVSNHLGYIDIGVLSSRLDGVFVAKSDVRSWPFFGAATYVFDTIFIDRTRRADIPRVNQLVEQVLARGEGLVVFPEGTSSGGETVMPFKPGLLELPARLDFPVSLATISYRTPTGEPPARTHVCWWGGMDFGRHLVGLFGLPSLDATLRFGQTKFRGSDRKVLASRLHEEILKLHVPVDHEPAEETSP